MRGGERVEKRWVQSKFAGEYERLMQEESGEDVRFMTQEEIEEVNRKFNDDLQKYTSGTLPIGYRFELGMPSAYLRSAGFDNLPISMRASLLAKKAGDNYHPFDASDLNDLV